MFQSTKFISIFIFLAVRINSQDFSSTKYTSTPSLNRITTLNTKVIFNKNVQASKIKFQMNSSTHDIKKILSTKVILTKEYENYLQFRINGSLNMTFEYSLNNQSSDAYKNVVHVIKSKVQNVFSNYDLKMVVINSLRKGSIIFEGIMYFNDTINDWSIKNLTERTGIYNVYSTEICTSASCSNNGVCVPTQKRNLTLCKCHMGFSDYRCDKPYSIDGVIQPWSDWASCSITCGNGTRRRFRYCDPEPINGGVCGHNDLVEVDYCIMERCDHSDDDYFIAALICGATLIVVFILLVGLCCTNGTLTNGEKQHSYNIDKFEAVDAYRVPTVAKRPGRITTKPENTESDNVIPLHLAKHMYYKNSSGKSNEGFYNEEDNEYIYKQQLDKFLKEASNLTSPYLHNKQSSGHEKTRNTKTPNQKVINHGPENYELVMI